MADRSTIKLPDARGRRRAGRRRRRAVATFMAFAIVACAPAAAQAADGWLPVASMDNTRYDHTATLLPSGKVLVTGGHNEPAGPVVASAELYDPSSGKWSPAASMGAARAGHAATLLKDSGKVLVSGGRTNDVDVDHGLTASAELYDPVTDTWSRAANMRIARAGHPATVLDNGQVLVAGGSAGSKADVTDSAELYDPGSDTWSAAADMGLARGGHTATRLADGKVLVAGGFDESPAVVASAELYDPRADTWSRAAGMSTVRAHHTATLLASGNVLVTGGQTGPGNDRLGYTAGAELYNPVRDSWSKAQTMRAPRYGHTATLLRNGTVLVAGGRGRDGERRCGLPSAELYDPLGDTWSPTVGMRTPRHDHEATALANGTVLVTGGATASDFGGVTASVELYRRAAIVAPQTTITGGPSGVTADRTPTFSFTSSETGSTFEIALLPGTAGSFRSCGENVTFGPLDDGTYTVSVRAVGAVDADPTPATRTFTVRAAPRAADDAYTTDLDTPLVMPVDGVLANDSDPNGDALQAVLVTDPAHGKVTLNPDGGLSYTPDEDHLGTDSFTYKASDGSQLSAAATVRVTVRAACGGVAATRVGTNGSNLFSGTPRDDVIVTLGGNDTIRAMGGNDRVCSGSGNDTIGAGLGHDMLIGGSGNDTLHGELGDDRLFGGAGVDRLSGDAGNDRLDGGADAPDRCDGGPGDDTATRTCESIISAHL